MIWDRIRNSFSSTSGASPGIKDPRYPVYLRVSFGAFDKALNTLSDVDEFAKNLFTFEDNEQSVYQANTEVEEIDIITGMFLCRKNENTLRHSLAFRIRAVDLEVCSITATQPGMTKGETGCRDVDELHVDLKGEWSKFVDLARRLQENHHKRCLDTIRIAGQRQMYERIQVFLAKDNGLDPPARKRCDKLAEAYDKKLRPSN